MIIKIEDAPNIKHIKIDINFDDLDSSNSSKPVVKVSQDDKQDFPEIPKTSETHEIPEVTLDLDETFDINTEVVQKPEIPEVQRDVKVSDEMTNSEF